MIAAGEPASFKHTPDGPSLRSKRGVEHFRRTDDTYSRAIRSRGAPTGATIKAPGMGLRQGQSESTNPLTVGLTGCADTLRRGPFTDRHSTFPGGCGVNRDKPYRRGCTREIMKRGRRTKTPPRSVSGRRRPSQSGRSPRHPRYCNLFHRRAHACPRLRQQQAQSTERRVCTWRPKPRRKPSCAN